MGALFDRYQAEIIPTKAASTQRTNRIELKFLRFAFGDMRPDSITPQDIYSFMDARARPSERIERRLSYHTYSATQSDGVLSPIILVVL